MKIAIVSGDDLVGDDPQHLSAALAARGHDVTAYIRQRGRRPAKAKASTDAHPTVPIRVGPRVAESAADLLPYVGEWAAALGRAWARDRPDVVHAYGWLGGLAAQLAARRLRIPAVQSFLGLAATSRPPGADGARHASERVEPLLARSAAWVTGECAADLDALAQLRRSRARMSALTSGVDVERFTPVGPAVTRTDLHRILCVAPNPLPCNGFDIAIRVLPRVPGAELVIAETDATSPDHDAARADLERLARRVGVDDRVRFSGTVAAGLPMLMRSADVVVCTPRQPSRATTVLQAMASGVVVVALAVGVLTDAVVDDVTGFLLPPESPGAVAAALRTLLAQNFQCGSMGAAGRSRALSRFSWDRIGQDALTIYGRLGSPSPAHPELQSTGAR